MQYLIDTHILLWWLAGDERLSAPAQEIIGKSDHIIYVSSASLWEISIKKSLGKLQLNYDLEKVLKENDFTILSITQNHACSIEALPPHHRDPFDRMLITQAMCEKIQLITHDKELAVYGAHVMIV